MRVAVPKETRPGEKRVALVPDIISKLTKAGLEVTIESGAGMAAEFSDAQFAAAGATVASGDVTSSADVVLSVQPLAPDVIKLLKKGAITISFLSPTTAADSIDALTSQALCAGYKAVLVGAELSPRFFPLLMTAAGTVTPANVVVLGAGVAGLQAIATAKRLGAVVSAYDVRPASSDEVKSMGAKFISLDLEALEGSGGYAREMTEDRAAKQRELLTPYIAAANVLITTAAVPGRTAPRLVTAEMIAAMAPGSVVVDLAAETGGNVEGTIPGEIVVTAHGVRMWGGKDVPSQLAYHASMLYSRNVVNLLLLMVKEGEVVPNFEDEIIDAATVTMNGENRKGAK
jgi:NAD(P) transhydrogenase subunit alpha